MITAENMTLDLGRGKDDGIDWWIICLSYIAGTWYVVLVVMCGFPHEHDGHDPS